MLVSITTVHDNARVGITTPISSSSGSTIGAALYSASHSPPENSWQSKTPSLSSRAISLATKNRGHPLRLPPSRVARARTSDWPLLFQRFSS